MCNKIWCLFSFSLNKLLLQRTNERTGVSIVLFSEVKPFFFNKGFPFRINFFIIWIKQHYILTFTSGRWVYLTSWNQSCFGGQLQSLFSRVSVSMVDLDFSVVAACCSREHFWVDIKFRNVPASDISPISGTCMNLLTSNRMLLFLIVVECQSRLNGRTYHVWSYLPTSVKRGSGSEWGSNFFNCKWPCKGLRS